MKDFEKKTRAYALKNAIAYKGKAVQGAVIACLFNEGLKKQDMKKYAKKISKIISEVNKISLEEQEKEYEKLEKQVSKRVIREGLPELPNVSKKGVIMRNSPSPSGPLHIGHAIISGLSIAYVKKYGGKFILRIEDTNPENIDPKAYKLLENDARWLYPKTKIIIQSDRMNLYYKYAEKLINKKTAYVCTCSADKFRELVKQKKACNCRELSVKENLTRWKNMLSKSGYKPGQAVLRFKSSEGMKHKNPAMRDFPLARVNLTKHPRTKNKYRVWPLMNLSVTADDIEMKMTHIIRGKDHRDNAERQKMMFKVLGKTCPWVAFIGRIHLRGMALSTTKMQEGIKSKKYKGWDDPRLPTLISLKKQGYKPGAFLKFAEKISLGENDKTLDKSEYFTLLKNFNKSRE